MRHPRGSIWRKWDLHIHTPSSYHWSGATFDPIRKKHNEQLLGQIVDAIDSSDVAAFAITDYWTFDGYLKIQEYLNREPGTLDTSKLILPGIELRLEAPVNYRLNVQVVFSDQASPQQLRDFLGTLRIPGVVKRPLSPEALTELGRSLPEDVLQEQGFHEQDREDSEKMHKLGCMTAKISRDSWRKALDALPRDMFVVVLPYDTHDGIAKLDWKQHPYDDHDLMVTADFFETRSKRRRDLFLGRGWPGKPHIGKSFIHNIGGEPKPVIVGSDAHRIPDYGKFPGEKACWLKGDLRFETLLQAKVDPVSRTYIGAEVPHVAHVKREHTNYIDAIEIAKTPGSELREKWFASKIPVNPGLVAIIGNKGSGKSALADIIALGGNSHTEHMSFLNDHRFCKSPDRKASHFRASISWRSGEHREYMLSDRADLALPERLRYLPQKHIENLCGELGKEASDEFQSELEKVIFSHVKEEDRLERDSLRELVSFKTEQIEERIGQLRRELHALNIEILSLEEESGDDNVRHLQEQHKIKEKELEACDSRKPSPVERPQEDKQDEEAVKLLEVLRKNRAKIEENIRLLKRNRAKAKGKIAAINRIRDAARNLERSHERFLEDLATDAEKIEISLGDIASLSIDFEPLDELELTINQEIQEIEDQLEANDSKGLKLSLIEAEDEINKLQTDLTAPERAYQKYCTDVEKWREERQKILGAADEIGSLSYYVERIQRAKTEAPKTKRERINRRIQLATEIFTCLQRQLEVYRTLYRPVHDFIEGHHLVSEGLKLEFFADLDPRSFPKSFLAFINQSRSGSFYQAEGNRLVSKIISQNDFSTSESTIHFLDVILNYLNNDKRRGKDKVVPIENQLAEKDSMVDLFDFLFGLSYLRPRSYLRMGEKPLSELSPGERGIILLVFYLLIERDSCPLIIDQPEENLDNESVFSILAACIKEAKARRQVIVVTHNPNLVVACDAEQIICATMEKGAHCEVIYSSGSIENPPTNLEAIRVLEGTWPAFRLRGRKYQRPPDEIGLTVDDAQESVGGK